MSGAVPAWVSGYDGTEIYVSLIEGEIARTKRVTPDLVALDYDAHDVLVGIEILLPEEEDS